MAEMEFKLDLGGPMREAMIKSLADLIDAMPQYRFAVILELLRRDPISRCILAEAIGEEAARVAKAEGLHQAEYDRGARAHTPCEQSWDQIATRMINELKDTPGGRGEAV